jgi:hypothetical protein
VPQTHPFPEACVIFLSISCFVSERNGAIYSKSIEDSSYEELPYLYQALPHIIALERSQEGNTGAQGVDPRIDNLGQACGLERISSPTRSRECGGDQAISMPANVLRILLPYRLSPISCTLIAGPFSIKELLNASLLFQAICNEVQ